MATSVPIVNMDGFVSWLIDQEGRMPSIPGKNNAAVLAEKLGLKESTIRKYRGGGTKNLQMSIVSSIASYSNLSLEEVIHWISTPGSRLEAKSTEEINRQLPAAIVEEIERINRLVALYPDYTLELVRAATCTCERHQTLPAEWVEVVEALKKIKGDTFVRDAYASDPERQFYVERVLDLKAPPDTPILIHEVFFSFARLGRNSPHRIDDILSLLGLTECSDMSGIVPSFEQERSTVPPPQG